MRRLIFLLLMCIGACDQRDVPASLVRDSAGISIIENAAPVWDVASQRLLSVRPLLDLGGAGGPVESQFEYLVDALQTPDRGFVLSDRGRHQLLFFDASGNHRHTAGGPGDGPGEFRDLGAIELSGDSVLAWDGRQRRLSISGLDGRLLGSVQLAPTADERHPIHFYNLDGVLEGELLLVPWAILPGGQNAVGPYWDSGAVYAYGVDGAVRRQFPEPHRTEMFLGTQGSSGRPFGARTSIATDGNQVFMGTGKSYEVRVFSAGGALKRIIRREWRPRPVTPAAVDSLVDHMIRSVGATSRGDPRVAGLTRALESAPFPDHMPAFSSLLTDPHGHLWVRTYTADYEDVAREWSLFDREGTWLARVSMPERFEVLGFGADVVFGVWRDPLDVQHFQVYGLNWPGS